MDTDDGSVRVKVLFLGGVKSGKSRLAEQRACELAEQNNTGKPYYLATTECLDEEMQQRIAVHQQQRADRFISIEEPLHLVSTIQQLPAHQVILIECVTMWINNMLYHEKSFDAITAEISQLLAQPHTLIFVLNEIGFGVIGENKLIRQFIDISGKTGQQLGAGCDEVHLCAAGLALRMK